MTGIQSDISNDIAIDVDFTHHDWLKVLSERTQEHCPYISVVTTVEGKHDGMRTATCLCSVTSQHSSSRLTLVETNEPLHIIIILC